MKLKKIYRLVAVCVASARIVCFYSYIVIVWFLMLNMLLAIIVDSYEHMKETVGDRAPPAWTDLMDLVKQSYKIAKYKKQVRDGKGCLSHEQVLERFDELLHTEAVENDIKSQEEREKDGLILHIYLLMDIIYITCQLSYAHTMQC